MYSLKHLFDFTKLVEEFFPPDVGYLFANVSITETVESICHQNKHPICKAQRTDTLMSTGTRNSFKMGNTTDRRVVFHCNHRLDPFWWVYSWPNSNLVRYVTLPWVQGCPQDANGRQVVSL